MTAISQEIGILFDSLVGSEAAIADFQTDLHSHLAPHADKPDAFARLQEASEVVIHQTICTINDLPPDDSGDKLSTNWKKVWINGEQGVRTTIGGLSVVSKLFAKHAEAPQAEDTVQKNTDGVLRHVYRNAFNSSYLGVYNLLALRNGRNPANLLNRPLFLMDAFIRGLRNASIHPRSLRVTTDEDGQLHLQPRYNLVVVKTNEHCPATEARIAVAGESPSALLTFMRTIGTVAVQDIFPHRFPIAPSE